MEQEILEPLKRASTGASILGPFDGRETLKKNPQGRKWNTRDTGALKGMVWHQEALRSFIEKEQVQFAGT